MTTSACLTSRHSIRSRCQASSSRPARSSGGSGRLRNPSNSSSRPSGVCSTTIRSAISRQRAGSPGSAFARPRLGEIRRAAQRPGGHDVGEGAVGDVLVQLVGADDVQDLESARRLLGAGGEEPGGLQHELGSALVEEAVVAAPAHVRVDRPGDVRDDVDLAVSRSAPRSLRPPGPVTNAGVTSSPEAADSHANHAPARPASSAWRMAAGSVCRRYSRSRRATSGSAAA